jgi:hypothetical protein
MVEAARLHEQDREELRMYQDKAKETEFDMQKRASKDGQTLDDELGLDEGGITGAESRAEYARPIHAEQI